MNQPVNLSLNIDEILESIEKNKKREKIYGPNVEHWDAYDEKMNIIPDKILVRGMLIPEDCYHLVCDIAVKHSKDGTYLLTQRDINKHFGGLWEVTAGGSALMGETPLQCAIRELKEETGIDLTKLVDSTITEVGTVIHKAHRTIYKEFYVTLQEDFDKDSIVLQEGETQAYRWVSAEELSQMKKDVLITQRMQLFLSKF